MTRSVAIFFPLSEILPLVPVGRVFVSSASNTYICLASFSIAGIWSTSDINSVALTFRGVFFSVVVDIFCYREWEEEFEDVDSLLVY